MSVLKQRQEPSLMRRIRRIHMVGIGGTGMSGIAEVLLNLGFEVSGSDIRKGEVTGRLERFGATVHVPHAAANVGDADVLVVSGAVPADNSEVAVARERRIPVVPRAEMLAELMRFRQGIGVAGSHGKTTTTSLLAGILAEGGLDPTFVIGGRLNAYGSNARLGEGRYLVAEADESDGSFLLLQPVIAVVTNIDRDHLDNYDNSFARLRGAFLEFLHHLPFYGVAVLCIDDPEIEGLLPEVNRAVLTFGFAAGADVGATEVEQHGAEMRFNLRLPDGSQHAARLNQPGRHNVCNALGAAAVAWELGVEPATIVASLAAFGGVGRRFADAGTLSVGGGSAWLVEDYGHHPTEIAATLAAARAGWPDRRLVAVFQPHRYSRTRALFDEFVTALSRGPDLLILTGIYAAGEAPIDGVDSARLCQSIRTRGRLDPILVADVDELECELPGLLKPDDLVLLMGAGDIGRLAGRLTRTPAEGPA